ncbi:RES family NAD+ phosphorylase [Klebsiella variicola]|uniref:RES domain-containing protein n=1 Tax=Klebsiella variicola TaxID=244366 RepID=UPI002B05213E|nr:RES domain-containing protein [Klebsiella variicola]
MLDLNIKLLESDAVSDDHERVKMREDKYVCHKCVNDKYVMHHIRQTGNNEQVCSYCKRKRKNIRLEYIVGMINDVFEYYYDTFEDIYDTGRGDSAQDVICEELGVEWDVAEDIYQLLCDEYNPYNDYDYVRYNDGFVYRHVNYSSGELAHTWSKATDSLLKETRYFNREVNDFLDSLFCDVDKLKNKNSNSPIKTLTDEVHLFRARVFEDQEEVKQALEQPEKNFGAPPPTLARSGRMNAQGISVFYGATSVNLAIAEVRPPVGSIVVTASFVPLRELKVLDISALDSLSFGSGSKFDPQTRITSERAIFFSTLSRKLTLPTFGKRQDSDYLITQVVADYLSDRNKFKLDGVSFKSTQVDANGEDAETGYNVVLFNKSSAVRHAADESRKYNVEMYEHIEDDQYAFVPKIQLIIEDNKKSRYMDLFSSSHDTNDALQMKTSSMTYHKITGVKYRTSETDIYQGDSIKKQEPPEKFDELKDF